jgi:hypothetical protein
MSRFKGWALRVAVVASFVLVLAAPLRWERPLRTADGAGDTTLAPIAGPTHSPRREFPLPDAAGA